MADNPPVTEEQRRALGEASISLKLAADNMEQAEHYGWDALRTRRALDHLDRLTEKVDTLTYTLRVMSVSLRKDKS